MNPRIYKKQAKRAVELLRSQGNDVREYAPDDDVGVIDWPFSTHKWRRLPKHVRRAWERISCIPIRFSNGWEGEWDVSDARDDLRMYHLYGDMAFDDDGNEIPPQRVNHKRRRDWISTRAIGPGWCWRGGRAVRIARGAP